MTKKQTNSTTMKRTQAKRKAARGQFDPASMEDLEAVERDLEKTREALESSEGELSPFARLERDSQVVAALARGLRRATVAERMGLTERHVYNIQRAYRERVALFGEPGENDYLQDTLELYESCIEQLALVASSTDNDSAKVAALKSVMDGALARLHLLKAMGRISASPGAARQLNVVVTKIVGVLDKHGLATPEIAKELVAVVGGQVSNTIEGTVSSG